MDELFPKLKPDEELAARVFFELNEPRASRILAAIQLISGKTDPDLMGGAYTCEELEKAIALVDSQFPSEDR